MSITKDIIRRALRFLGELQAGQEPTGPNSSDGLEYLQSTILGLPGLILNGEWRERATSVAYTACEGARVTVTAPGVVTLPATVTWGGYTRPPIDLARVQIIGEAADNAGIWIYSATKAAWGRADALTINSEIPFGEEDDAGLAALLAVNMADDFGPEAVLGQRTVGLAQQAARTFRARFKKANAWRHDRSAPALWDYP